MRFSKVERRAAAVAVPARIALIPPNQISQVSHLCFTRGPGQDKDRTRSRTQFTGIIILISPHFSLSNQTKMSFRTSFSKLITIRQ